MHAVGDPDGRPGEQVVPILVDDFCMSLADTVDPAGHANRHSSHVELQVRGIVGGADIGQVVQITADQAGPVAEVALDQREVEHLVAGRDRRVQSKGGGRPDLLFSVLQGRTGGDLILQPLEYRESCVSFVDVPHGRLYSNRLESLDRPDTEDHLLTEPHLPTANVKGMGDRPVGRIVLRDVRVQH